MIDKDKQYRTRDGRAVRILATDAKSPDFTVITLVSHGDREIVINYRASGRCGMDGLDHPCDLLEVKPKYTRWFVVAHHLGYATKEGAVRAALATGAERRLAVKEVTFEEGEGL